MNIKLRYLAFLLSIFGWLPSDVLIGKTGAVEEAPYFTNQDIEHYKEPSDIRSSISRPAGTETKKESAARLQKQKEGEFWCKKARSYQKRIRKDQEDVQDIENSLEGLKDTKGRKKASLEKKLAKAKKHLGNSEEDLAELGDEAHRKGIPPGWLRCQFD